MLTHCVFFWCKPELSPDDRADFEVGLRSLLTIPSVTSGSVGKPAPITRPVVDSSYSFALMLQFHDRAAHDSYQVDAIHNAFHARCLKYWDKVLVYDFVDGSAES